MCGIVAYSKLNNIYKSNSKNFLKSLIYYSKIRGVHSFGCSYYLEDSNNFKTEKFTNIDLFFKWFDCLNFEKVSKFIYHNRYSTFGSSFEDELEIQPVVKKDISLCFNGVISQESIENIEKNLNVKFETKNDGELFLLNYKNRKEFIKNEEVSFSGVWLKENYLHCLRNKKRPAYIFKDYSFFLASTKDIFIRSSFDKNSVYELTPFEEISM